jgi:hypothetical protein
LTDITNRAIARAPDSLFKARHVSNSVREDSKNTEEVKQLLVDNGSLGPSRARNFGGGGGGKRVWAVVERLCHEGIVAMNPGSTPTAHRDATESLASNPPDESSQPHHAQNGPSLAKLLHNSRFNFSQMVCRNSSAGCSSAGFRADQSGNEASSSHPKPNAAKSASLSESESASSSDSSSESECPSE